MRKFFVLCLILLLALPTLGHTTDPASTIFEPLNVSNVRLQLSQDDGASLIFNAAPTVCDPLFTDVTVTGQFITVNAFVPPSDSACETVAPFEPTIELPDLATETAYVITINNFVSRFYLADPDAEQSDEAFVALWDAETPLVQLDSLPSAIGTVDFISDDGDLNLRVTGDHPDGCETDEFVRLRPDAMNPMLYHAELIRLLPQGVMCPAMLQSYDLTTSIDLPNGSIIEVNGEFTRIEDEQAVTVEQQALNIVTVDVLDMGSDVMVVVSGDQMGECLVTPQSSITERDYMTLINIASFTDSDASCDESAFFTEAYFVDMLPVMVNGIAYDEDGEIPPRVSGQGGGANPPEGNFMRSDTVIESVEVIILESSPMQLQLMVSGFQPDGCDFPVEVEQTVDGNEVTLHIFRNVPMDVMCPSVLNPYDDTIMIDGTFDSGTVNIRVNDFETSVDL
ncbi:MAG: hypothetical protein AAFV93_23025 [Chloroflexota bacterium]